MNTAHRASSKTVFPADNPTRANCTSATATAEIKPVRVSECGNNIGTFANDESLTKNNERKIISDTEC